MGEEKQGEFDPARPDLVKEKKRTGRVGEETKSREASAGVGNEGELNRPEGSSALMDPVITANPD